MNLSVALAAYVGASINREAQSALPDAPVVASLNPARARRRMNRLRGHLANSLHRAAWAIEPVPRDAAAAAPDMTRRDREKPGSKAWLPGSEIVRVQFQSLQDTAGVKRRKSRDR
jgi:hypothetical protein